jgi:hypothetical protein
MNDAARKIVRLVKIRGDQFMTERVANPPLAQGYRGSVKLVGLPPFEGWSIKTLKEEMKELQPVLVTKPILLYAFRATVADHNYNVGFGIWDAAGPSMTCFAVMESISQITPEGCHAFRLNDERSALQDAVELLQMYRCSAFLFCCSDDKVYNAALNPIINNEVPMIHVDEPSPDVFVIHLKP